MQLPKDFCERMKAILKGDYRLYIQTFEEPVVRSIRVNTHYVDTETFVRVAPFQMQSISYTKNGFYIYDERRYGTHPYHHGGLFYYQDPGAMAPINSLSIKPTWTVLDMCASPGGKSCQIAEQLTEGVLIANEIDFSRAKILFSNIERQGFSNTIITNNSPKELMKSFYHCFDLIIADCPCSGEGMFRKDPQAIEQWSVENINRCVVRDLEIIKAADHMLRDDGFLIYSTCTYAPEENEEIVKKIIEMGYQLIPVNERVEASTSPGIDMPLARRFYPHSAPGEGQFFALLQKVSKTGSRNIKKTLTRYLTRNITIAAEFVRKTTGLVLNYYDDGKFVYHVPENVVINDLHVITHGVIIGAVEKDRLIPHHQYFKAFGNHFFNKLVLDINDPRVNKYLHGEEIFDADTPDGYGVIILISPLGGYKASNGCLKNWYPKGLRNP